MASRGKNDPRNTKNGEENLEKSAMEKATQIGRKFKIGDERERERELSNGGKLIIEHEKRGFWLEINPNLFQIGRGKH